MNKPDDLVLFEVYDDAVSAYIAKGVLETNGIQAMVTNELMSGVLPLTMLSVGQVRLLVKRSDLETAHKIIEDNNNDYKNGNENSE